MGDFRTRLFDEYGDLKRKIEKLKNFIISDTIDDLPKIEQSDLKEQLKYMQKYLSVLSKRVSRQCS